MHNSSDTTRACSASCRRSSCPREEGVHARQVNASEAVHHRSLETGRCVRSRLCRRRRCLTCYARERSPNSSSISVAWLGLHGRLQRMEGTLQLLLVALCLAHKRVEKTRYNSRSSCVGRSCFVPRRRSSAVEVPDFESAPHGSQILYCSFPLWRKTLTWRIKAGSVKLEFAYRQTFR